MSSERFQYLIVLGAVLALGDVPARPQTPISPTAPKHRPAAPPAPAAATTAGSPASEGPKRPLLGFCATPVRPACVDAASTYAEAKSSADCQRDVDRYVATVFDYRACLNLEVERAIKQANETINRHRCRLAKGKNCG